MQAKDVTAYGCDYSAREFTPDDLDHYPGVRIEWLARYIGYPNNPKCISAYPNAYRRHRDAGRPVVLYHQIGYRDFEGGYESGRAQAAVALADAKRQGWDGETPILACFDRRMAAFTRGGVYYRAIPLNEVREYVRGFVSVIGWEHAGFYGFEDTMKPCVEENWVRFRMQCGARSAHIPGIQAWQENNEQPYLLGTQTDRLELYISKSELGGEEVQEMGFSHQQVNLPATETISDVAEHDVVFPDLAGALGVTDRWVNIHSPGQPFIDPNDPESGRLDANIALAHFVDGDGDIVGEYAAANTTLTHHTNGGSVQVPAAATKLVVQYGSVVGLLVSVSVKTS